LVSAAETLQKVLRLLDVLDGPPYNLILHTAPLRERVDETYHWHWEIHPRLREIAGLELGTGLPVNPVSPEEAVAELLNAAREAGEPSSRRRPNGDNSDRRYADDGLRPVVTPARAHPSMALDSAVIQRRLRPAPAAAVQMTTDRATARAQLEQLYAAPPGDLQLPEPDVAQRGTGGRPDTRNLRQGFSSL
jgi:hypothetical protein